MKKSLKTTLIAGLAVVAFGSALTFCTSKTEKPVEEAQDTTQTKEEVVANDTTATDSTSDTTAAAAQ
jgi:hypothetical protein